ncbi:acyl carrier protein [Paenibacillus sp. CGMCC 1.18879]|uniref:acyl carrier protein n=1 Tax=Paenibacillus sp. CGMCC 1.18879 TaxID=2834466 RepID=UPI001CA95986|nr:acyl carrier protein [Paenibacillus sp. CGMCC 1.18879]MBY9080127.1 acyl carrier protein [Paenibacillus sp. CGMCC 1.18879]
MVKCDEKVIEVLKGITQLEDITMESSLTNDLLIDSLSFIRVIVELENGFHFKFDNEDMIIEMFPKVMDLAQYIKIKS